MDPSSLKRQIVSALATAVEQFDWVDSATLTGSFLTASGLSGISDIDFVVIVDRLNGPRFEQLQESCERALAPVVRAADYKLRINPTLGPLKLNDAQTAVLHLMIYSRDAHVEHVINSPFTCLDWQRSETWFKRPLADVSTVYGLQPRHFLSARRSISDYLRDFRSGNVSFRELVCCDLECREVRRELPMQLRDSVEFAWHIMRFLMQNFLKLVRRRNETLEGSQLCAAYLEEFSDHAEEVTQLFAELYAAKKSQSFTAAPPQLDARLEKFVLSFERQFRRAFVEEASRHIVIRHAPTSWNAGQGDDRRFIGRSDVPIERLAENDIKPVLAQLHGKAISAVYTSPLSRCRQTLSKLSEHLSLPMAKCDARLLEIDYGHCEGLTVAEARLRHPELFVAWKLGNEVSFPSGEGTAAVRRRVLTFAASRWNADFRVNDSTVSLTCTHNVPLRILVGHSLSVPQHLWHRLNIAHLRPYEFLETRRYGLFADIDEAIYRSTFADLSLHSVPAPAIETKQAA